MKYKSYRYSVSGGEMNRSERKKARKSIFDDNKGLHSTRSKQVRKDEARKEFVGALKTGGR